MGEAPHPFQKMISGVSCENAKNAKIIENRFEMATVDFWPDVAVLADVLRCRKHRSRRKGSETTNTLRPIGRGLVEAPVDQDHGARLSRNLLPPLQV